MENIKFITKREKEFQQKRIDLWCKLVVAYTSSPSNFIKTSVIWADDILKAFDQRFKP